MEKFNTRYIIMFAENGILNRWTDTDGSTMDLVFQNDIGDDDDKSGWSDITGAIEHDLNRVIDSHTKKLEMEITFTVIDEEEYDQEH